MYLDDEAWPEVGGYGGSLALVPLGSTEQHGPHLPEGTDHLIARGLAREAASRTFGARTSYDAIENSDNGAFGDPSEASPEAGERLFEAAVEQLVRLCGWLDDQPFEDLTPAGPVRHP